VLHQTLQQIFKLVSFYMATSPEMFHHISQGSYISED